MGNCLWALTSKSARKLTIEMEQVYACSIHIRKEIEMYTIQKSKTSANELNRQIEQHLKELAQATDKARTSEEMLCFLNFCAKFHQYSAGNIWLILLAKPDASYVDTYSIS